MAACPDENDIVAFAEGRLSPSARNEVEAHLDGCDACRTLVAQLAQLGTSGPMHSLSGSTTGSRTDPASFDQESTELDARFGALPRPGHLLAGRFRVGRLLGRGGMGVVFEAVDETLNERVALKLLAPELAGRPEYLEWLYREMVVGRRVSHPNVCRMHDLGTAGELHFISMEYVPGQTLETLLQKGSLLSGTIGEVLEAITVALAAAHAQGVVHRDLKPRNVMVTSDGRVKVMDFGLALDLQAQSSLGIGQRVGTPGYWAPEQAAGAACSPASDLYALGVVAYRSFANELPRVGRARGELPESVPVELRPLVDALLEPDPAKRPGSATEVAEALLRIRTGQVQRYHRPWVALGAVLAISPAVVALYLLSRPATPPAPAAAPVVRADPEPAAPPPNLGAPDAASDEVELPAAAAQQPGAEPEPEPGARGKHRDPQQQSGHGPHIPVFE